MSTPTADKLVLVDRSQFLIENINTEVLNLVKCEAAIAFLEKLLTINGLVDHDGTKVKEYSRQVSEAKDARKDMIRAIRAKRELLLKYEEEERNGEEYWKS